jgi:hypothetical protein
VNRRCWKPGPRRGEPVTKLPVAVQGPKWFRDGKRLALFKPQAAVLWWKEIFAWLGKYLGE